MNFCIQPFVLSQLLSIQPHSGFWALNCPLVQLAPLLDHGYKCVVHSLLTWEGVYQPLSVSCKHGICRLILHHSHLPQFHIQSLFDIDQVFFVSISVINSVVNLLTLHPKSFLWQQLQMKIALNIVSFLNFHSLFFSESINLHFACRLSSSSFSFTGFTCFCFCLDLSFHCLLSL